MTIRIRIKTTGEIGKIYKPLSSYKDEVIPVHFDFDTPETESKWTNWALLRRFNKNELEEITDGN